VKAWQALEDSGEETGSVSFGVGTLDRLKKP
jgi:hypothetical protein